MSQKNTRAQRRGMDRAAAARYAGDHRGVTLPALSEQEIIETVLAAHGVSTAQVTQEFEAAGGRAVDPFPVPAVDIHRRLGPRHWSGAQKFGLAGWRFQRWDNTLIVIVTCAVWPGLPDVPIIHASISRHYPVGVPTYADLQLLHRAVFPGGNAMQAFVPPGEHVNIRGNVLHLWGRADGQRLWPVDFGAYRTI